MKDSTLKYMELYDSTRLGNFVSSSWMPCAKDSFPLVLLSGSVAEVESKGFLVSFRLLKVMLRQIVWPSRKE